MLRSARSWADTPETTVRFVGVGLALLVLAIGLAGRTRSDDWVEIRRWLPDVVVGIVLVAAGTRVARLQPLAGGLLWTSGLFWFAGDLIGALLFVHRAPLLHLAVAFPTGRPRRHVDAFVVGTVWLSVFVVPIWTDWRTATGLCLAVVAVTATGIGGATGRERQRRITGLQSAIALTVVISSAAIVGTVAPNGRTDDLRMFAYQLGIALIAVFFSLRVTEVSHVGLHDLVVDVGDVGSRTLRGRLADVLGDPEIEIGFRDDAGTIVDSAGAAIVLPATDATRLATAIEQDGRTIAVVVHDRSVLDDPGLIDTVATALRLAATNVELDLELGRQLESLRASRRRLVDAADDERRSLEAQLRAGVQHEVLELASDVRRCSMPGAAHERHLRRALEHLEHTADDLEQLARGLHPRDLDRGLAGAIASMVERCPIPVSAQCDTTSSREGRAIGPAVVAAYYVCAEALSNMAKHSRASRGAIIVVDDGHCLEVTIDDDGIGVSGTSPGSGIQGLADRVDALGGRLVINGSELGGTRVQALIPTQVGAAP